MYLAVGATDLRKGFDGLYGLVRSRLEEDPMSGQLFVFCNAGRTRVKALYFDGYATRAIMGHCSGRRCCPLM
ncbi:MAG: IS66 family insertion sequence element accessory protein TnpB [Terrimicrobiaceae bacterium]